MHFITTILACTSVAYTRKLDPYPLWENVGYYPHNYEHKHQAHSDIEKVIYYPNSFNRIGENLESEEVFEKNNGPDNFQPNGLDTEYYSKEPEVTSPPSELFVMKDIETYKLPNPEESSEEDSDSAINNTPPSKIHQEQPSERPKYNDYNKYPPQFISLSAKSHEERPEPKYSDKIKYPNNLPCDSNKYQDQSKYANDNKYYPLNNPKQNTYQNQAKKYDSNYNVTFIKPSKNAYSLELTYQAPSKYGNFYKPGNSGLASPHQSKKEGPKFSENSHHKYVSSSISTSYSESSWSSEEEPKPKVPNNKSSLTYSYEDSEYYEDEAPPTPHYLAPQYVEKDPSELPAPPFYKSLKDFEDAEKFIQSRIFGNNPNHNGKQFTVITGVLDGMIKAMAHTPWKYYDQEYKYMAPKFIKYAQIAKEFAKDAIKCANQWVNHSITKIRAVINNDWINYICQVSDVPCDTLVLAVVDSSYDPDLKQEARLLLALGKTAELYLNKYAKILDREATITTDRPSLLYDFILKSQQFFKPLIKASSEAHNLLPDNYKCPKHDIYDYRN